MGTLWGTSHIWRLSLPLKQSFPLFILILQILSDSDLPHRSLSLQTSPCVRQFLPSHLWWCLKSTETLLSGKKEQSGLPVTAENGRPTGGHLPCPPHLLVFAVTPPQIPKKDPVGGYVQICLGLEEVLGKWKTAWLQKYLPDCSY